jgi:UDP-N-acetylmuramoyl-L-alanyl-D-glutamate--2,6-diaminopimelate ligase
MQHSEGIRFVVGFGQQSATIEAPVFGDFNVENLTATLAVMLSMGYQLPQAVVKLSRVYAVPGRMENFSYAGRSTVIDYAHTPDALRSVLATMRKHCSAHLWVVFGCGGDRDRGKRAEMGKIADQLADRLVITDDNPRNEDADSIVADIVSGVVDHEVIVIRNRQAAIRHALESSAPGDLVLIAGKGHENYQEVRGVKYPFSDREIVETILRQLGDRH